MYNHNKSSSNQMKHHSQHSLGKKKKELIILISLTGLLFFINVSNVSYKSNSNVEFISEQSIDPISDLLKIAAQEPNGKPLLVSQYANITESYTGSNLPTNVSFILQKDWISKNINISFEGVSQKKNIVKNGTFDSDYHGWTYKTNDPAEFEGSNQTGTGSVQIKYLGGAKNKDDYAYFEQNISLQEELTSGKLALLSLDYFCKRNRPTNFTAYLAIIIGNVETNITYDFPTAIQEDSWETLTLVYNPVASNQILPGNVTVRAGIYTVEATSVGQWGTFDIDNIQFDLWTKPNQMNIVRIKDVEFNSNYTYINTTYGKGYYYNATERTLPGTGNIEFTISQNIIGIDDFDIAIITITANLMKRINSSMNGLDGSLFTPGTPITWRTNLVITIPNDYKNNRAEITKPPDWNITQILDGYDVNRIQDCTGTNPGSVKFSIPNGIFDQGLWEIEVTSSNYIANGSLFVWNETAYIEESSITMGSSYRINVGLNDSLIGELTDTQINFTIEYPNGTIFYQNTSIPYSIEMNFGTYDVGKNMTIGTYQVILLWTNNQSYSSRDKVGFLQFGFDVWHHTNLTAVKSYEEKVSGEPFLMKVEFFDDDSNIFIDFATVTYNSTFGTSGTMVYFGSGVYVIDMDISGLPLGNHYFSFNASKIHYENQSIRNLIQLKIINQTLALEIPQTVINVDAYSYAILLLKVKGASSGTLLPGGANITTDWHKEYWVTDHLNGTATLNFSTNHVPDGGIIETFTVTVFANKTNFGSTSAFISITVHPLSTDINVNASTIDVKLNTNFILKLNYSDDETDQIISEAILNVSWGSSYNILSNDNNYIINFSTFDLSLGSYTLFFQLSHPGYETAFANVYVNVLPLEIDVETIALNGTLDVFAGGSSVIRILLTEESSGNTIDNANVTFSWRFRLFGELEYVGNGIYELILNIPESAEGAYTLNIIIITDDPELKNRNFPLNIYVLRGTPTNFLFIGIVIALLSVVGVLATLSLRSYVIIPRKRKNEQIFQNTIQVFKDVKNIQAVMFIQKLSGVPFFNKDYTTFDSGDNSLLSGFIQAITIFGEKMINGETSDQKRKHKAIYSKHIIELNFKYFHLLICDYQSVRSLLILKEHSSDRLKRQFYLLSVEIDAKLGDKIEKFSGDLTGFETKINILLDKFLSLYYSEPFKLVDSASYMQYLKKSRELQSIDVRILNVIIARTKFEKEFTLNKIVEETNEKNIDLIYGSLLNLIGRNIIVPIHYKKGDSHPLLGGLK
ncbi:hypothetical protein LCGC14_0935040 [marine sediment metagenome]|uniref:Uncharacterized protein n=1 Tax=marine sediment metagenome TaxID=412755 RepID=A0A0F9RTD2_9ZZZZ